MRRIETGLPGVWILEPVVHRDPRGFFLESYRADRLAELGITGRFVQDNHARSGRGTLRGLHYQLRRPQAKLCRVVQGAVLDVSVDIRRGSPTFGRWTSVTLSEENCLEVFVPTGFAHGYLVLSDTADFLYKCDDYYQPDDQFGIAWNDPQIGIEWPLDAPPLLSERDRTHPTIEQIAPEHLPVFRDEG